MSERIMKQNIENAVRRIDAEKDMVRKGKMRQGFHFMPQTGWLNDPNGLIYFRGKYHFFYQYNPYGTFWDRMFWGHAISDDMLHWEYLPPALAPSEVYDDHPKGGCFSGSAIEHNGRLFLMYTGAFNKGNGYEQTQCIAYSDDGIHFTKYEGNPVITAPEGVPRDMFRDPKVWKHDDMFYMVCGAARDDSGMALIYRSDDMLHWEYFNVLCQSRGEWGKMWECPDFYALGDKYVLTFSPVGSGDHTSVYLVGDFDYKTGKFDAHISGEINWGFDYYAPQSFLTPDGRRIMVAWANEWEWMPLWKDWGPTFEEGWCGFFNIPVEVSLNSDNTLRFQPIKEMEDIKEATKTLNSFVITNEETEIQAGNGIVFEIKMKIDIEKTDAEHFDIMLRCGEGKMTICRVDLKNGELSVDRNCSDGWSRGISKSTLMLNGKKELDVHILSDKSSLEIFTDGYRNNHSNNVFASDLQNKIKVRAEGGSVYAKEVQTYGLKNCCL